MRFLNLMLKQLFDFLGSLFGLIIISPFILLISISIKFTSKGPVFYTQERLGRNGKVFKIIKFRTMVENAENIGTGLFVRTGEDNRITKIGKFLRATSLDEIPQLFNVLFGQMSLVGPRPPVPYHPFKYNDYNDKQRTRFKMKPGMTGLTQVTVRNSVPWNDRILIDVQYIEEFNLWLDLKIIFKTFIKLFKNESIYTYNKVENPEKSSRIN